MIRKEGTINNEMYDTMEDMCVKSLIEFCDHIDDIKKVFRDTTVVSDLIVADRGLRMTIEKFDRDRKNVTVNDLTILSTTISAVTEELLNTTITLFNIVDVVTREMDHELGKCSEIFTKSIGCNEIPIAVLDEVIWSTLHQCIFVQHGFHTMIKMLYNYEFPQKVTSLGNEVAKAISRIVYHEYGWE